MDLTLRVELTKAFFEWYADKNRLSLRAAGQAISNLIDTDVDRLRAMIEEFKASR